jgi:hypothetical protein
MNLALLSRCSTEGRTADAADMRLCPFHSLSHARWRFCGFPASCGYLLEAIEGTGGSWHQ